MPAPPRVSVVLLTWNEEANIRACLRSLARQTLKDFEVILLDAASADATVAIARAARADLPVPLQIEVASRRVPIGEARNRGVQLAAAPFVAFLSADAEADPRWLEEALQSLAQADYVFGRQVHAPHRWNTAASVRGLRYHFPEHDRADPLVLASNVSAVYRKAILEAFPFDPWANAAEDLLLARRAQLAGFKPAYNPRMLVRHHDVATTRQEFRKTRREGEGWAVYRAELGLFPLLLVWGALLLASLILLGLLPGFLTLLLVLLVLYAPVLRRAARRHRDLPRRALLKGTLASPVFDLVFLASYLRGLTHRAARPNATQPPQETHA